MTAWLAAVGVLVGTFVSEDAACLTAGALIEERLLHPVVGVLACFLGIMIGDVALWATGRYSVIWMKRASTSNNVHSRVDRNLIKEKLARHAGWSILLSRFMPGLRVPVYLAAGAMGVPLVSFISWMALAAAIWTPVLVLGGGWIMGTIVSMIVPPGSTSVGFVLLILVLFFVIANGIAILRNDRRRGQWLAKVSLLWRWEFWPTWLFYLPLVP